MVPSPTIDARSTSVPTGHIPRRRKNMGWNPDTDALAQILGLLRESQSPDTIVQQTVQQVEYLSLRVKLL